MSHFTWNRPTLCVTLATSDASLPSVCSLWYALSASGARRAKSMTTSVELITGSLGAYSCRSRALLRRLRRPPSSSSSFASLSLVSSESSGVSESFDSGGVSSEVTSSLVPPPLLFLLLAAGMVGGPASRRI